ncbi:MAG: CPBP family intramembrane metalloprotease, partial [bacterium]|nr:CPBP family intramembrane metalloprotease [bacterium]
MIVNWSLIIVLFCLSIPGVYLVMTRLIFFLLPNNTPTLKKRFSRFAVGQTLLMVLVMSFAGTVLSVRIGLHASLLAGILPGESEFNSFIAILLPIFLYTLLGLVIFIALYYGMVSSILDEHSMRVLNNLRLALGVDGSALYGVAEEIIARWGLMNFFVFFAITVTGAATPVTIFVALMVSAILFAIGQIPAYIA